MDAEHDKELKTMSAAKDLMAEILTEEDVAKILRISVATLRNRISDGENHPPFIKGTRPKLFFADEVRTWLKQGQVRQKSRR